jgi:hypothetical protein
MIIFIIISYIFIRANSGQSWNCIEQESMLHSWTVLCRCFACSSKRKPDVFD